MNKTPIIEDAAELAEFARFLADQPVIAVDLEADSMHHFTEQVCLLQFTAAGRTMLLDPLALPDLEPLRAIFANPRQRKLFHAADYDLRCLRRDFDLRIDGLFDSMIAAQLCGEQKIGLADLLGKYFDLRIDKKYQRADWTIRPLPGEMIAYAAGDTADLERLAGVLEQRLEELGRTAWHAEECALLQEVAFEENGGPLFLRFKGAGRLDRRQLAILEQLLQWRIRRARKRDVPPFKIIGNKPLLAVATAAPQTARALGRLEGMFPRLVERFGRELLECVSAGLAIPEKELPAFPRGERRLRDPEADKRFERLKQWRRQQAERLQLDPGVMINNALLEAIAYQPPGSSDDFARFEAMRNWQRQEFGAQILQVLDHG
ncbi:ribonuclease D [Geothermobacter hydrogeniphilus]|uniref:Ribonuclease D n=1 Tax=Geothermobacter hydrogeniphilus TaxID=1969733 RepID=A0A1X0XX37_9BACT|nr:HRDC domain-containing protein [Geothermobacter hydrogeniphilus]ORJ57471.1 ribonuclease D [Geothermobacter hydrogeniphilus]